MGASGTAFNVKVQSTGAEQANRQAFLELLRECPIPDAELLPNLGLFLNRQTLSRILFMHELYRLAEPVHGVIMEFGVRWGQTLALMSNFRGMHEPFNYNRRVIGFDTFEGFPSVAAEDAPDRAATAEGDYAVTPGYQEFLDRVLRFHQSESPIAHVNKHELVRGDVTKTLPAYLSEHQETIVALAYFDLDLYAPTKACLEALRPRLTRGSVLAFDELNHPSWPGETRAVMDALGMSTFGLRHLPWYPSASFLVVDAPLR